MSYCTLGITCKSNTIAYTSNNKFISLRSPVYIKQDTYMMQYPASESTPGDYSIKENPDHEHKLSKAFYGKIFKRTTIEDPKNSNNNVEKSDVLFNSPDRNHEHVRSCKNC